MNNDIRRWRMLCETTEHAVRGKLWYHGSEDEFDNFNQAHVGTKQGKNSPGFWFTDNPDLTGFYGHIRYTVRIYADEVAVLEFKDRKTGQGPSYFATQAAVAGYDAIVLKDVFDGDREATNVCVFSADDIEIVSVEDTSLDETVMFETDKHWREFRRTDKPYRAELKKQLAIDFSGYQHPNTALIIGMRRAYLQHGITPEEMMKNWLNGTQVEGMKKLPVPHISFEYRSLFRRLVMERDSADSNTVKNALWVAINVLSVQAIDPDWKGKKLIDLSWPNHIDDDFVKRGGELREIMFSALANDTYRIIYGRD